MPTAMRTLRVLLSDPPAPDRADPWVLVDEHGAIVSHGRDVPARRPAADRRDAVIAASAVRLLSLALPPLPSSRVDAAVQFALEERLATPLETSIVIAGAQAQDGRVQVLVVPRLLAGALVAQSPRFDRIVAEPALASVTPRDAWRWCASDPHGFVMTGAGEAFAVGAADDDSVPGELRGAIEQSARSGRAPLRVIASVPDAPARRETWTRATGVPFETAAPWRWDVGDAAPAGDLVAAIARALAPLAPVASHRTPFAGALVLLAAALLLHALATVGTWAWRKAELAQVHAALAGVAAAAGVKDAVAETAAARLARLHADAKHRAGHNVASDGWPLLAQAAPALAALPDGTLRTARFAGGAWTLDLGPIDDGALAELDARLQGARLAGLVARSAAGVRVRIEGEE